jgi:hypothetical protein
VTFTQRQRVGLTVAAILLGIAVIVSGFRSSYSATKDHDRIRDAGEWFISL